MSATPGAGAPALVLGFAACLDADVEEAARLFPDAVRFGVNRAVLRYRCDHLVSIDRSRIPSWLPDYPITVHAGRVGGADNQHPPAKYPWVHHWWPHYQTGGSSAWMAAKIARHLGHAPIVLCGCPIDDSPHVEPDPGCPNAWQGPDQVEACRRVMMEETEWRPFVRSMSGWTRGWFGSAGTC